LDAAIADGIPTIAVSRNFPHTAGMTFNEPLPIDDALPELRVALATGTRAVLVAPPGAGKTTRVPLDLLDAPWLGSQKVLVLEPRRLAARGAATRMAHTLGEALGERVGMRARLGTKVSACTRIEVITEGVFTRMILDDPSLDGVGAVLFDEFHERSLDADLGLALALDCQAGLREDLRLLVMSATLDGARVARLLDGAPVIESAGRAYPVETRYLGRDVTGRLDDQMAAAIMRALAAETGSILAFLPGQGEILRVAERLAERITDPDMIIAPLYGAMDTDAQDVAVSPCEPGTRKVVLATSIAETSLTIEGVRVVIDCGLARVPRYEPEVGVTRLETVRVSRASADQRRGRAGRTQPGVCYRLWDAPQDLSLLAYNEPEIKAANLAGLVLDCAEWGAVDPLTLAWLDPPPTASLSAAKCELVLLGALDEFGLITSIGKRMRRLPLPPRLARMVLRAADLGQARAACDVAAVIVERGLGGSGVDLDGRVVQFRRESSARAKQMRGLAEGWVATAGGVARAVGPKLSTAALLAMAYPDRIAKAREARGQYLLANGRGAMIDAKEHLAASAFLVVAELTGVAAAARIMSAVSFPEIELAVIAGDRISDGDEVAFEATARAVRARRVRRLDAIVLASEPRALSLGPEVSHALAAGIGSLGVGALPWSAGQLQLRARVAFLRDSNDLAWPDLSDEALGAGVGVWLAPYLEGKSRLDDVRADDLGRALDALVPWDAKQRIEAEAPTQFEAPTGNRVAIDYDGPQAPSVHIRVQELFGLKVHPAIAGGRRPLTLHLLSPAHRPIQITKDLPGFWAGSWSAVKSEMKGRYPRHVWPDDPARAAPTARAKPRGT
jgi:ATP-dependent helicase HrpB